ncbi:GspH/FimT family pseudopilin [Solimonas fluminis]|nr:GspH/FimT family pseudopilin [Solimonas fluminis]
MSRKEPARGFSLMELLITIAVIGILMGIAIPSFRQAALASELRATANSLLVATVAARSEAIKRNAVVALCPSSNGSSCGGTWEQGWIVSCATSDNINCTAGGSNRLVLQAEGSAAAGVRVIAQGGATTLNFDPTGAAATAQVFKICRERPLGNQERVLTLTATGRGSITKTTTGACP